jgi:hypothetical protein
MDATGGCTRPSIRHPSISSSACRLAGLVQPRLNDALSSVHEVTPT